MELSPLKFLLNGKRQKRTVEVLAGCGRTKYDAMDLEMLKKNGHFK